MSKPTTVTISKSSFNEVLRLLRTLSNLTPGTRENPPEIGAGMLQGLIEDGTRIKKDLESIVD